jgi:hypothetical protein
MPMLFKEGRRPNIIEVVGKKVLSNGDGSINNTWAVHTKKTFRQKELKKRAKRARKGE